MWRRDSEKKGNFARGNKADPMMNDDFPQLKVFCRRRGDLLQLMFGHGPVRLVIDAFDCAAVLQFANHTPEINNCTRGNIDIGCSRDR